MTTTNNNSNTPDAAAWAAMSPAERSVASKEMLRSILRAESLNKDIQELLKVANVDAAKEVLKELCEELAGKPLPTAEWFHQRNPDLLMDMIQNVGKPSFGQAFTAYHSEYKKDSSTTPTVIERNARTISAAQQVGGWIQDDHTPNKTIKLWGVATLDKGDKQTLVALLNAPAYSINLVYLGSDGKARLSTSSVGGVLELRGLSVEDAIVKYNDEQGSFPFSCGLLNNVVKF